MALTEEQRNPWRAIVAGGDYNLTSQDWEDLLTELDSLYTEAPIAQPASAPSEQKPVACFKVYRGELCYRSQEDDQSYGMWCPVTQEYAPPFPQGTLFYTSPQPDYKAQRDALMEVLNKARNALVQWHVPENRYSAIESIDAAIASVKGGAA